MKVGDCVVMLAGKRAVEGLRVTMPREVSFLERCRTGKWEGGGEKQEAAEMMHSRPHRGFGKQKCKLFLPFQVNCPQYTTINKYTWLLESLSSVNSFTLPQCSLPM